MRQSQIWLTVTGTRVILTRLGLVEASKLIKIGNKVDLSRSNRAFFKTRVKTEKLKMFCPGILWDRPRGVAKAVVIISPHYRGKNGSLVPIGHKGRFLPFENSKK